MEKLKLLVSQQEIEKAIGRIAEELKRDYRDQPPLLVGVLKGAFVFMADLIRALDIPVEIEFVKLSSYGTKTKSSGKIRVVQGLRSPIRDRDVLVVEDIVDTGLTIHFLLDYLAKKKPRSLKLCALLDKPSSRQIDLAIDYKGMEIPDVFVVGYGIDYNEKFRYLPEIYYLEETS
ncbi:MAG: hypoxanthine phosphoribosyltransferase [Chloroflexi bacterium]|nr:hypoxanthine phosphoribosyltransferase [Chloroflexota bacterium]